MTTTTTTSTDLAKVLVDLGVDVTRAGEREISGRCPVHAEVTGHDDRSPSWSMNATSGLWICYSCGSRGSLPWLVSKLTGDPQSAILVDLVVSESILDRLERDPGEQQRAAPRPDQRSYQEFDPVPSRLLRRRGLDRDVCHNHGVRFDPVDRAWIIPIISPLGELMGWQAKKTGWFMNVPDEVPKSETLFGIERFKVGGTAVLLESPLDVVRLASVMDGVQGLASFGVHVSVNQIRLLVSYCDRVIIALDNDKAGVLQAERLFDTMTYPRKGILFLRYAHTKAKDIGDMTDDEIEEAVLDASPVPWWYL